MTFEVKENKQSLKHSEICEKNLLRMQSNKMTGLIGFDRSVTRTFYVYT